MNNSFVQQKTCGECSKLRTQMCKRPDYCVGQGYSDFSQSRPWERCEQCGAKLLVKKTDPNQADKTVITEKYCPDCGLFGDHRQEWVRKGVRVG